MEEQANLNLPAHNAADRGRYDIYEPCCLKWLKRFVHFEHCRTFCSHPKVASAPLEGHYDSSQCRIGSFTDFSSSQQLCCLQHRIFGHSAPFEPYSKRWQRITIPDSNEAELRSAASTHDPGEFLLCISGNSGGYRYQ